MNVQGKLTFASSRLLRRYPLHGAIVSQWRPRPGDETMSMGVGIEDGRASLTYAPAFVERLTIDELVAVLHHEVNHVLGEHLWMTRNQYPNKTALTIATEVTANEYIREPLPGCPVVLSAYPCLPADEDAHTRYEKLKNQTDNNPNTTDDHAAWQTVQMNPEFAKAIFGIAISVALDGLTQEQRTRCSASTMEKAVGMAAEGRVTSLGANDGKAGVDWRRLLRRYVGQELDKRPTYSRPPRRFPRLLGIVPAQTWQGGKPHVLAIIDTSASITNQMLRDISTELGGLASSYRVTVVECDTSVRAVYPYRPIEQVSGRGGTDLRPPLKAKFLRKHRVDLAIYFTDGHGPAPKRKPTVPVIWCLTTHGRKPVQWGRDVKMLGKST